MTVELISAALLKQLAVTTLQLSFRELKKRVDEARRIPPNATLCQEYLGITRDSLRALEREVDEILVDAYYCNLADKNEARLVCKRIDNYIYVHRVIYVLRDAAYGVETCQMALKKDQSAFMQNIPFLTADDDRKDAVTQLMDLLPKLHVCINNIIYGLEYLSARAIQFCRSGLDVSGGGAT